MLWRLFEERVHVSIKAALLVTPLFLLPFVESFSGTPFPAFLQSRAPSKRSTRAVTPPFNSLTRSGVDSPHILFSAPPPSPSMPGVIEKPAVTGEAEGTKLVNGFACKESPEGQREEKSLDSLLCSLVAEFKEGHFCPPWYARDCHTQTIVGTESLQQVVSGRTSQTPFLKSGALKRQRWETPDGDFIDIDFLTHTDSDLLTVCRDSCAAKQSEEIDGPPIFPPNGALPDEYLEMPGVTDSDRDADPKNVGGGRPVVLVIHGLESNSRGANTVKLSRAMFHRGFDVMAVNFRSCATGAPLTGMVKKEEGEAEEDAPFAEALPLKPKSYHVGFTYDLNFVTRRLRAAVPDRALFVCGFSLGGNVCAKFLGELGTHARSRHVWGGAVACVPMDPVLCQLKLDDGELPRTWRGEEGGESHERGTEVEDEKQTGHADFEEVREKYKKAAGRLHFNRRVYSGNFLKNLRAKALSVKDILPSGFNLTRVLDSKGLGEFDDTFMASVWGFRDYRDYYSQNGAKWYLPAVRVPLFGVNALDDPFIAQECLPSQRWMETFNALETDPRGDRWRGKLPAIGLPEPEAEVEKEEMGEKGSGGSFVPKFVRWKYTDKGGHLGYWADVQKSDWSGEGVGPPSDPFAVEVGWYAWELSRFLQHLWGEIRPPK